MSFRMSHMNWVAVEACFLNSSRAMAGRPQQSHKELGGIVWGSMLHVTAVSSTHHGACN